MSRQAGRQGPVSLPMYDSGFAAPIPLKVAGKEMGARMKGRSQGWMDGGGREGGTPDLPDSFRPAWSHCGASRPAFVSNKPPSKKSRVGRLIPQTITNRLIPLRFASDLSTVNVDGGDCRV